MSPDRLQYERDVLMASLEDLEREHDRGDLSDGDYSLLRDRYTVRAAEVLRALEGEGASAPAPRPEPRQLTPAETAQSQAPSRQSRRRWWLAITGASLLVIVVSVVVVTRVTSIRLPGETATGSVSLSVGQLQRRTLAQAEALERQGNAAGALRLYHEVLEQDPVQEEALAESGWLEYEAGVKAKNASALSEGQGEEQKAERADPSAYSPHLYLGSMLLVEGDATGSVAQYRSFLADGPPPSLVRSAASFIDRAFQEARLPSPPLSAGS